jgi:hypothetical protein
MMKIPRFYATKFLQRSPMNILPNSNSKNSFGESSQSQIISPKEKGNQQTKLQSKCVNSDRWNSPEQEHKQTSDEKESGCEDIVDVSQGSHRLVGWVMREEVSGNHGIHDIQVAVERWILIDFLYVLF